MGVCVDFTDFSFGQSIEQTTKTTQDLEVEFDELQQAKLKLLDLSGKLLNLQSIDYILIMMENLRME